MYITDNTFTRQDVVSMEADILLALQFELGCPTIKTFLRLDCDETVRSLFLKIVACPRFDCFTLFYVGFAQTVHKGRSRGFQCKLKPTMTFATCKVSIVNSWVFFSRPLCRSHGCR